MCENKLDNTIDLFSVFYSLLSDNSKTSIIVIAEKMLTFEKQTNHVDIQALKEKRACSP